jgi:dATP pyrophosphohydrolase
MIEAHVFRETESGIEFLLIKRSEKETYSGLWQMVTGRIEENEKATEAAVREIKEETGYTPEQFWVVPNINRFYSRQNDSITFVPVFAARVDGKDLPKLCNEHCDYKWLSPGEAKKLLAWPGWKQSVDIIEEYYLNAKQFMELVEIKTLP